MNEDWATIVGEIDRRARASSGGRVVASAHAAAPVGNPNGHGRKEAGGVEHRCGDGATMAHFTPETIAGVARQYALDIARFGFM